MPSSLALNRHIAFFSPHVTHIGETKTIPRLAAALVKRGFRVDLLDADGEWLGLTGEEQQTGVRVVDLNARRYLPWIPDISAISPWASYRVWAFLLGAAVVPTLSSYMKRERPSVLVARMLTVPALIAHAIDSGGTKIVISMGGVPRYSTMRRFMWPRAYPRADAFVSPAEDIAKIASHLAGVSVDRFHILPNPVLDKALIRKSEEPPTHPWTTNRQIPLITAVGRLTRQKGFETLIRSFAILNRQTPSRLLILGEGELRRDLSALIESLGVKEQVDMPGHDPNPYRTIKNSDVFVMSSRWEGPGHVLIEAQAIGTPCVSTACPAGPRETLLNGEAGLLVPVDDPEKMANAILKTLTDKDAAKRMAEKGKAASKRWFVEQVADEWAQFLANVDRR